MYAVLKICDWSNFIYISKCQSDFAILQGFYFCESLRRFTKIKPLQKFLGLQYTIDLKAYLEL